MVDRIETKRGLLHQQRVGDRTHPIWVTRGSVSLEEAYEHLPKMIPDTPIRDKVEKVMDQGSKTILDLLESGGIVTNSGLSIPGFQKTIPLTEEDALKLKKEAVIMANGWWLINKYRMSLPENIRGVNSIAVFREHADTALRGEFKGSSSKVGHLRFYFGEFDWFLKVTEGSLLANIYKNLYSEMGIGNIIGPQTLLKMLFLDICETFGQGFKQVPR